MLPARVPMQCLGRKMAQDRLTIGEAARAIGVSADTLRRWERAGKLRTTRDAANRRLVSRREVERLSGKPSRHRAEAALAARDRFPGWVRTGEYDWESATV